LAGRTEFEDGDRFFQHFHGHLTRERLNGLCVLDLGCGYGGRTVYYAKECGAAEVVGIEPFASMVERGAELADELGVANVRFQVGRAEELPLPDASCDAVVSFDVIEHVDDPTLAFKEIRRVLRPGGHGWLVFPTYRGARASHLDFITRIPALHRIFDPFMIVEVVNERLAASDGRYGLSSLDAPRVSPLGHLTLPGLNGITRNDALRLMPAARLRIVAEHVSPFIRHQDPVPGAGVLTKVLSRWHTIRPLPDLLIGSLAYEVAPQ
jgi:SAM-dependent methyltransferase